MNNFNNLFSTWYRKVMNDPLVRTMFFYYLINRRKQETSTKQEFQDNR